MKRFISVSALALFVIVARPQQQPPPPHGIEEKMKRTNEVLAKEVQPDAQQKVKIEAVYRKFFTAEEKLRKNNPPKQGEQPVPPPAPDPKTKEAMDKLVKERDENVKKILDEKQFEKYKEAVKKLKPPRPGEGNGQKLPPRPQQ